MIHFNELRITKDGKYLIIDASVDNQDFYDNVVLDSIVIDTQDTYIPNGPSSKPIYEFKVADAYDLTYSMPENCSCNPVLENENKLYCFTYGHQQLRNIRLVLQAKDINIGALNDTMFFIYIISSGTPSVDAPCSTVKPIIMGSVINLYPLYQRMMEYVREIENNCEIPKNFIDLSLKIKALELCIRTGNYPQAIKYWNKFFKDKIDITKVTNCGCYG